MSQLSLGQHISRILGSQKVELHEASRLRSNCASTGNFYPHLAKGKMEKYTIDIKKQKENLMYEILAN
jgi:hypothetical protein